MPEDELFGIADRVGQRLSADTGNVRVGAGRAVPGGEARRSFHEARCALEAIGFGVPTPPPTQRRDRAAGRAVATYKDLGSFQLLLSLQDDEALRLFCDSILGPIEASEGHYGGELMRSWRPSSRRTGSGRKRPSGCTATGTPCATGSAEWRS